VGGGAPPPHALPPNPLQGAKVSPAGSVGSQLVCHWHTLTPWTPAAAYTLLLAKAPAPSRQAVVRLLSL